VYSTVYLKYLTALKGLIMDATLDKYGSATSGPEKQFAEISKKAKSKINDLKVKPGKAPKWRLDAMSLNMWNEFVLKGKYEAWKHRWGSQPNAKVPKQFKRFAPGYQPPVQNPPGSGKAKARRPRGPPWWAREPRQRPAAGTDVPPPPPRENNPGESYMRRDNPKHEIPYGRSPSFMRPRPVEPGPGYNQEEMGDECWW
jgi:hypothetical protein